MLQLEYYIRGLIHMNQFTRVFIKFNKHLLAVRQFEKQLLNEEELRLIRKRNSDIPPLSKIVQTQNISEDIVKTVYVFDVEGVVADGSKELNAIKGAIIETLDGLPNGNEYFVEEIKMEVVTTVTTIATLP